MAIYLAGCKDNFHYNPEDQEGQQIKVISYEGRFETKSSEWSYIPFPNKVGKSLVNGEIDSIIFEASVRSESFESRAVIELYDSTRHKVIRNSTLYSPRRYYKLIIRSQNISYNIPEELVNIYVRYRTEENGNFIEVGQNQKIFIYYR